LSQLSCSYDETTLTTERLKTADPASAEATDPASAEAAYSASAEAADPASAEAADLHQLPAQVQKTKPPQPLLG
jgi:hypothetical protein